MNASTLIFQRTQAGRDEIKEKSHGLTQSERLVLIMVDGVTTAAGVRNKLPALTDQRFARALNQLLQKELILEVFIPVDGQAAEELDQHLIERFLRQEPLDPVTIIVHHPEDEFSEWVAAAPAPVPQAVVAAILARTPAPVAPAIPVLTEAARPIAAMDRAHVEMAESLAAEVRLQQDERVCKREEQAVRPLVPAAETTATVVPVGLPRLHWGYWLIALGVACLASFCVARLTA